jgi:hypothetical protein
MKSRTTRLLRSVALTVAGAVALGPLAPVAADAAPPAAAAMVVASPGYTERDGRCRFGGEWQLDVERMPRGRIRIDFEVDEVGRRQRWQVFVSNNGRRVAAATRFSRVVGEFQLRRRTLNRRGRDRIAASAVNTRTGNRCSGFIRF